MALLPRLVTKLAGSAVSIFYELERTGPALPSGPLLVAANHPNSLIDPLVIFHTAGRATRPLAKAPLFEQALLGSVLRGLGGLPVYRKQDDPELMHLNDRTFDAAIDALIAGGAVQIYPEGRSHSEPAMSALRTGAARIALMAEERADWKLGLRIQPVGLTYIRKPHFRGRAIAAFGEPIAVAPYRQAYEADAYEAARDLTAELERRLHALTINADHPEDLELVDVAERLYTREKRLAGWREREPLAQRLPRLRRFAEGLRWLRGFDPERLETLSGRVRRYLRLVTLFGASEGDVPKRYPLASVLGYSVRQLLMLLLVLPAAVVGAAAWAVPYLLTGRVAPRMTRHHDQIATYKVSAALIAFPVWLLAISAAAWLRWGTGATVGVALALPVAGLAAVAWHDRQSDVREDVRIFMRTRRSRRGKDRLAEMRRGLVEEFDAIAEAWDTARRGDSPGDLASGAP